MLTEKQLNSQLAFCLTNTNFPELGKKVDDWAERIRLPRFMGLLIPSAPIAKKPLNDLYLPQMQTVQQPIANFRSRISYLFPQSDIMSMVLANIKI